MDEDLIARFDVYEANSLSSLPLVLDVQADLLSDLQTRVVVPLKLHEATKRPTQPRLEPVLLIVGRKYVPMTADIGTVQLADFAGTRGQPRQSKNGYHRRH